MATAGNMYTIHGNYKLLKPTKMAKTVAKGAVHGAGIPPTDRRPHAEFHGEGPGAGTGFSSATDTKTPEKGDLQ